MPAKSPVPITASSGTIAANESRFAGSGLACLRGGRMVFAGLGFALEAGGLLVLTGPNGSGKSSLLRMMAGLLPPAAGTITFDAADDGVLQPRLAYLGHLDALKPQLTVAEELAFSARLAGPSSVRGRAEAIAEATTMFALGSLVELPCRYLSAGQRRRVALARVAAARARLWLLDEPTTALDDASTVAFGRALARHRADGGMAAIASHQPLPAAGTDSLDLTRFAAAA